MWHQECMVNIVLVDVMSDHDEPKLLLKAFPAICDVIRKFSDEWHTIILEVVIKRNYCLLLERNQRRLVSRCRCRRWVRQDFFFPFQSLNSKINFIIESEFSAISTKTACAVMSWYMKWNIINVFRVVEGKGEKKAFVLKATKGRHSSETFALFLIATSGARIFIWKQSREFRF